MLPVERTIPREGVFAEISKQTINTPVFPELTLWKLTQQTYISWESIFGYFSSSRTWVTYSFWHSRTWPIYFTSYVSIPAHIWSFEWCDERLMKQLCHSQVLTSLMWTIIIKLLILMAENHLLNNSHFKDYSHPDDHTGQTYYWYSCMDQTIAIQVFFRSTLTRMITQDKLLWTRESWAQTRIYWTTGYF